MKVICDISVTSARNRSREGWHPGYLFRGGAQGAWYDPSDTSTLFQDVAGTLPVAADGDPVGLIQDKSGNANHLTQATPAACPTWRTDGVLFWLEFDGVDDHMVIPAIAYTSPFSVCLGLQRFPSTAWGSFRSPLIIPPYVNTGASHPTDSGTDTNTAGGTDRLDGQPSILTRIEMYNALQTPRVGSAFNNTSVALHEEGTFLCYGQLRPSGKVFNYVELEAATLADVQRLEHWIANKTGITL